MLATRPTSARVACAIASLAVLEILLGAHPGTALDTVAPLATFLAAALTLARLVERSGLADRAASALAALAAGRVAVLYAGTCATSALLTAIVSLDGAVVLVVPMLLVLARRYRAPFGPLYLGAVAVANAGSVAVPQGNPTNLVVMGELGIGPAAFIGHMLLPGVAAAVLCAAAVGMLERRSLAARCVAPAGRDRGLSRDERHAALTLATAALAAWLAPLAGIAPWWPFAAVVGVALLAPGQHVAPSIPWKIVAQVGGLLVTVQALGLRFGMLTAHRPLALLLVAVGAGAASALVNNLPASAVAASLVAASPTAYAATIGLGIGALTTPHGSVATLLARDLSGDASPPIAVRRLALLSVPATLLATALLAASR